MYSYKLNKVLCIAIALFLNYSCTKGTKKSYQFYLNDFKSIVHLKGEQKALEKSILPIDICVIPEQNLLLVIDIRSPYFVEAYNMTSLKYIKSFIQKGVGPNQQIGCQGLQYDRRKNLLYASDPYKKKIFIYAIKDVLDSINLVLPIADISLQCNFLSRPIVLPTNNIVDFHRIFKNKPNLLDFYSNEGYLSFSKGEFPQIKKKYNPYELNFAFAAGINASLAGDKIIVNYYHTDYIDMYDNIGNLIKRVQGPDIFEPKIETETKLGSYMSHLVPQSLKAYTCRRKEGIQSFWQLALQDIRQE